MLIGNYYFNYIIQVAYTTIFHLYYTFVQVSLARTIIIFIILCICSVVVLIIVKKTRSLLPLSLHYILMLHSFYFPTSHKKHGYRNLNENSDLIVKMKCVVDNMEWKYSSFMLCTRVTLFSIFCIKKDGNNFVIFCFRNHFLKSVCI